MARVAFEQAGKRFGAVDAVADLTLEIEDGEFLVLVGPSGSGKTTALRLLAGLESVSSGHMRIGERIVDDVPPRDRDIAMVFRDYALYPQMTVRDNLGFGLRMRKADRFEVERRVRGAAEALELGELLDRKPRELSGGQRQRVALGRALVRDPQVFLMDEPLSNLDAALRVQTRGEIRRLQKEIGTTTVYVTHDQVEAMTMGDRIVVMNRGRLEQAGAPATVYDRPANVFVAGFIGSPAMSFCRFRAEPQDGRVVLARGGVRLQTPARRRVPPDVIVGVRPEHARLWHDGAGLLGPLDGRVEYVEALGRETLVGIGVADDARFVVVSEGKSDVDVGDSVRFGLRPDRLYLFDAATGQALPGE